MRAKSSQSRTDTFSTCECEYPASPSVPGPLLHYSIESVAIVYLVFKLPRETCIQHTVTPFRFLCAIISFRCIFHSSTHFAIVLCAVSRAISVCRAGVSCAIKIYPGFVLHRLNVENWFKLFHDSLSRRARPCVCVGCRWFDFLASAVVDYSFLGHFTTVGSKHYRLSIVL